LPAILFALLCGAVWLLPAHAADWLSFDRAALWQGQWWRLWTCHLTHYTLAQLSTDASIIVILGFVLRRYLSALFLAVSLLLVLPLISGLMLLLMPEMSSYRGASAVGALLWVWLGCTLLYNSRVFSFSFWLGGCIISLLATKIIVEKWALLPPISNLPEYVQIAWQAHLLGAVSGLLLSILWQHSHQAALAKNRLSAAD